MNKHSYAFRFSDSLSHSKGPWKNHKYIKKEGNRYYYKKGSGSNSGGSDLSSMNDRELYNFHQEASEAADAAYDEMDSKFDVLVGYGLKEGRNGTVRGMKVSKDLSSYFSSGAERKALADYNNSVDVFESARQDKLDAEAEMRRRAGNRVNAVKSLVNR